MIISTVTFNLCLSYYIFLIQSPNGSLIASGAIDGIINLFDLKSGKLLHTLEGKGCKSNVSIS